ncbi:MAG TPA: AAA family ATPase [Acidimicrobiia bacterium]|nr:AAA family ATPase [Acidimicrobiia bacterium]
MAGEGLASGTATVLFTDLVGSTELMARLGDAVFDRMRAGHFEMLQKAIATHGGAVVKNTGDGLLATFPSAVAAVSAAVAMQQATDRKDRFSGEPLAIRIGLSIGEVGYDAGDVFGTPVVEAARLVAAARPGQILTTTLFRAMAGSRAAASFTDLGTLELKGLPDPVAVSEVTWAPLTAAGPAVPLPQLLTGTSRIFVGRDDELQRLDQLWKEASAGERRLALVAGEPGIGKTRLAAELAGMVHADGAVVLAGRCDEDLGVPYQPFVEALRHYVGHSAGEGLVASLGRHGGELVRLVPDIAGLVSGLPEPLRSDPETERYRLFDAVAAWLGALSAEAPVLLILDDLHWAAKPTLLLLRHVLRAPDPARLLLLGTYRDTELSRTHPLTELLADLHRSAGVQRWSLPGLDTAAVVDFLERAAGHDLDRQGEELARVVRDETEGNPFFVAEILRHLIETGAFEQRDGRWVTAGAIEELGIPEGVRDVVGRRLARLSEVANRALTIAAVAGPEFDPAVVAAAGDFLDDDLVSALDEAVAARLVNDVGGLKPRYRFAHALVRVTLYDELTSARRVGLHRRVARAIEAVHANHLDDHLPALAHHYARLAAPADETAKAVEYATRAGDRALAQLAHDEAVAYYRQALELLTMVDGSMEQARLGLMVSLGEAEQRAGDPASRRTLFEAAGLARDLADGAMLARAALANSRGVMFAAAGWVDEELVAALEAALDLAGPGDSAMRARLLAKLGLELHFAPDAQDRRVALSDEALVIARRLEDLPTLAAVLLSRYSTIWTPDNWDERLANLEELEQVTARLRDPVMTCHARSFRYRLMMEVADVVEADRALAEFAGLADELGQPVIRWLVGWPRTARLALAGRLEEAERVALETMEIGVATGQADAAAIYAYSLFPVRLQQGRLAEFEPQFLENAEESRAKGDRFRFPSAIRAVIDAELGRDDQARSALESMAASAFGDCPIDVTWPPSMAMWAEVAVALGDASNAAVLRDSLNPYRDRLAGMTSVIVGTVAFHLGLLATTTGDFAAAESDFAHAETIEQRIGAPTWLARTRLEWARMLLRRSGPRDSERARELLTKALDTAREYGLARIEAQAGALLLDVP